MNLWRLLTVGFDRPFIAHWSEARAKQYERETWRYMGVRPEPHYTWSRKFRPKAQGWARATVTPIKKRA